MTIEKQTGGTGTGARVVVLGASDNPERYSNRAVRKLVEQGYEVVPVHPRLRVVEGLPVVASLGRVDGEVDTVTVYVNASVSGGLVDAMAALKPRRVVFNPGAEAPELAERLRGEGIEVEDACTLVLLGTGQF